MNFNIRYADTIIPFLSFIRIELANSLKLSINILTRLDFSSEHVSIYGRKTVIDKIREIILALPQKHHDISLLFKMMLPIDQLSRLIVIIQDSLHAIHKLISILNSKPRDFF